MKPLATQILSLSAALLLVANVQAQQNSNPSIAVVDIAKVFKNHAAFKQKLDAMKAEFKTFQTTTTNQLKALQEQATQLQQNQQFKPGTAAYKRAEADIAQRNSDIRVQAKLKQKELLQREARLYYDTYQEVREIISQLAEHYGLSMVLRFDSEVIDSQDFSKMQGVLNRFVIVAQPNVDLTNAVLRQINSQAKR